MPNPSKKPHWPHENICHLVAHMGAGQWSKTHRGQTVYFGVLRDPDGALKRYLAWARKAAAKDPIARTPPPEDVTLYLGINHFLTAREQDVRAGDLSPGQYVRYRRACKLMLRELGRDALVADLTPAHFARLRAAIPGGPVNVGNVVRDCRSVFGFIDRHYRVRPAFGDAFRKPGKKAVRHGSARRRLYSAAELRAILAAAEPPLRAMVLLGINCGFGQTDCALFARTHFDLEHHWFPRPKNGIARRCPLWPKTLAALACFRRWRPDVRPDLVFISKYGKVMVRDEPIEAGGKIINSRSKDAIGQMFRRACKRAGVESRGFYCIRHTFRSVADRVPDVTALRCIMGRELGEGADAAYVQLMDEHMRRLRTVTDHVHAWLFSV